MVLLNISIGVAGYDEDRLFRNTKTDFGYSYSGSLCYCEK